MQQNGYVAAKTLESEYLANIKPDYNLIVSTLFSLQGKIIEPNKGQHIKNFGILLDGYFCSKLFNYGITDFKFDNREYLEESRSELASNVWESSEILRKQQNNLDHFNLGWDATLLNQLDEYKNDLDQELSGNREKLTSIEQQYREAIRLEAPVRYWKSKRSSHRNIAILSGLSFIAILIASLTYLTGLYAEISKIPSTDENLIIKYIILFGVPAFAIVWIMRIFSRLLIRNIYLYDDAKERISMIETFLALMQEKDKVSEEDRILILSAIFRTATNISNEDDTTPPNWFDILLQRIKPK